MVDRRPRQQSRGESRAARSLELVKRLRREFGDDQLSLVAAGVAFYGMLALFPGIVALVTTYALIADPARVPDHLGPLTDVLPGSASDLLVQRMADVARDGQQGLTIGLVTSLAGALWAASGAIDALIKGINIAYDQTERRGFLHRRALALGFTLGATVVILAALWLIAVVPGLIRWIGAGSLGALAVQPLRWALLTVLLAAAIAVVYRYGPSDPTRNWRTVAWGLLVALLGWTAASVGFSVYVSSFGRYDTMYGALAAPIVLQLWLYLGAWALLLGAELNGVLRSRRSASR